MTIRQCFRVSLCILVSIAVSGSWVSAGEKGADEARPKDAAWVQDASKAAFPDRLGQRPSPRPGFYGGRRDRITLPRDQWQCR